MTTEVLAPLAGNVWEVLVALGDSVAEDDELLIIEALKMENPVYAPCAGKIAAIKVQKGEQIDEDAVVMLIE